MRLHGTKRALLASVAAGGAVPPPAGMSVWLDANAIIGLADTDPMATWLDQSGNGFDYTQGVGGLQPLYRTGQAGGNGLPSAYFDGADYLARTDFADSQWGGNAATIYVLANISTANNAPIYCRFAGTSVEVWWGDGTNQFIDVWHATAPASNGVWLRAAYPGGAGAWQNNWHLLEFLRSGSDGEMRYDNGVLILAETDSAEFPPHTSGQTKVGHQVTGFIAEVLAYTSVLGAGDRQAVRDYFNDKYALW